MLHLQIHQLGHGHHVVVQICHDPERSGNDQEHDEQAEGERQHVVGVVRSGRDVQEKDQVNAHLGDGEDGKAQGDAGRPEQRRVGDPERRGREDDCENQSDRVDEPKSDSVSLCASPLSRSLRVRDRTVCRSWTNSHQIDDREQPDPDDVERVPEQGEAEQAALARWRRKPLTATCAIITASQISPAVTCSPWQPTSGEERGKKSAALRGRAAGDHAGELADLESEERGAEHEGDQGKEVGIERRRALTASDISPAGVARNEKTGGFDRDADLIEQLGAGRSARRRMHEHRVGSQTAPRT